MDEKTPPIPKPRTVGISQEIQSFPESPSPKNIVERLNNENTEVVKKVPPPIPPPPLKRSKEIHEEENNGCNKLELNLVAESSTQELSPPMRMAPPPPRPPSPGWVVEKCPPMVPERVSSRKPQSQPENDVMRCPSYPPPTLEQALESKKDGRNYIENPVYMSLTTLQKGLEEVEKHKYETLADMHVAVNEENLYPDIREYINQIVSPDSGVDGLSPSAPVSLPGKDIVQPPARPVNLDSNVERAPETQIQSQLNTYTPNPKRSDFEDLKLSLDPFEEIPQMVEGTSHNEIYLLDDFSSVVEPCSNISYPVRKNVEYINLDTSTIRVVADGSTVSFFGYVVLIQLKREKRLHCILRDKELKFYENEESTIPLYGTYNMSHCTLVRPCLWKESGSPSTSEASSEDSIQLLFDEGYRKTVVFRPEDSVQTWMMFLAEVWLAEHPQLSDSLNDLNVIICGRIWVKQGTTAEWTKATAAISNVKMSYILEDGSGIVCEIDLRTVLGLREKTDKSEWCAECKHRGQQRGAFLISIDGCSIFIETKEDECTSAWFEVIKGVLNKPAKELEQFRLTADFVPHVVDKCIKFVAAFGLKSEGIYRRNGRIIEAREIMKNLMEDPVGVHLVEADNETVYAVADVLRQFFRRLSKPLICQNIHKKLFELAKQAPGEDLWKEYSKVLIEGLPKVHYTTLKKLVAHIKVVNEHAIENRASVDNLGKVFGASIFHTECEEQAFTDHSAQISVMVHLITNYDAIFKITEKEEISRFMVQEAEKKSMIHGVRSDGLLIPIHMWEKENLSFNVKTSLAAEEVCQHAISRRGFDGPSDSNYAIFEVIRSGNLRRRLTPDEKLSTVILDRWLEWKITDGWLVFDHDLEPFSQLDCRSFTGKVKLADVGSKTFKSCELRLEESSMIRAYRGEKRWKTWSIQQVCWYIGAEPSRKPPNEFNLTMIFVNSKGLAARPPGICISFSDKTERTQWLNALEFAVTGGLPASLVHF